MYTKFYDNTIITKFVNYLLSNFNIPLAPFYTPDVPIRENNLYIYDSGLYRAKASVDKFSDKSAINQNGYNILNTEIFEYLTPYAFGDYYPNITTTYTSASSEYSPTTHYYLGEYIRAIKGFYGVDLMPFYNCFNGIYLNSTDIKREKVGNRYIISPHTETVEDGYKILSVPIKFRKKYTIFIESDTGFDYCPVIYGRNTMVTNSTEFLLETSVFKTAYKRCDYCSFSAPFVVDEITSNRAWVDLEQYAPCLRLLIKLPESNESSIVVLEGDYTNQAKLLISEAPGTYSVPSVIKGPETPPNGNINPAVEEKFYGYGALKFTWINDGQTYAFTDTLPQYLLLNVISNADDIDANIIRVQQYVTSEEHKQVYGTTFNKPYVTGVWSKDLQDYLFNLVMRNPKIRPYTRLDISGYVDKITEQAILRGQKT